MVARSASLVRRRRPLPRTLNISWERTETLKRLSALGKRMIVDGRMPTPEEAQRQLDERLQRDRLGEPLPPIAEREPLPRKSGPASRPR